MKNDSKWKTLTDAEGRRGVRYREHPTRKHGAVPDRYYTISYWWQGKTHSEGVGWASEGHKPNECFKKLAEIKHNQSTGRGPCTLAELRKEEGARRLREANRNITLEKYWLEYFKYAKTVKKASSYDKEESHFRNWIQPICGKTLIQEISFSQWDLLVSTLDKAGKSKRTKEYVTGTLRRILKHAYDRQLIDDPPPTGKRIGATGPGNANRRMRVINPVEKEKILKELHKKDIHAWRFTKFAFLTGCRASEALNLRWRNVDLDAQTVTFPETKNKDSRTLPVSAALKEIFNSIGQGAPEDFVFKRTSGARYTEAPQAFFNVVNDTLKLNAGRTDREKLIFHSIRHTVATELAKRLSLRDLMDLMGWRTTQMAMRYVKGDDDAKRRALADLGVESPADGKVIPMKPQEEVADNAGT